MTVLKIIYALCSEKVVNTGSIKKIQNTNDSKYIDCTYKKSSPRKSYIQYSIHISIKLLAYLRKIFLASTITYMNIQPCKCTKKCMYT